MKTLPPSRSVERCVYGAFSSIMWAPAELCFLSMILLSCGGVFFQIALSALLSLTFCTNAVC